MMSIKTESSVPCFVKPMERRHIKPLLLILIILLLIIWFFPIYWLISTSLKLQVDAMAYPPKFLSVPTFKNYGNVFGRGNFQLAYRNSAIVSSCAILISLLFGLPAAYGINRFRFRLRRAFTFWVISTRFIPPVVVIIPFYLIFRTLKLLNTLHGMVLIHVVAALPLVIWIMYGFFEEVPFELEESAAIDGAAPLYTFINICIPLVAPGIVATVIIALINSWNEFIYSMVMTSTQTRTLPVAIYSFVSYEELEWTNMCAAGALAILPILIFTVIVQKYMITGLTFGSVKS